MPIIAVPMPLMTVRTSAKSRLMRPSLMIRSTMQAMPEWSTWSAMTNASANVVFSDAMRKQVLVRDDDQRIDEVLELGDAGFGDAHAPRALEQERLGDDADGEDSELLGDARDHGRRAGTRTAAHAGGDEDHVRARDLGADLLDGLFGRRLADLRPRACSESFGQRDAELQLVLSAGRRESLGVRVGDDEVDTHETRRDHVVDRVAAGATDTNDRELRLQVRETWQLRPDGHPVLALPEARASRTTSPIPLEPRPASPPRSPARLRDWN